MAQRGSGAFGLLLTILLGVRHRPSAVPPLVASYIYTAYWFTASSSFANPAVTLARSLTQTFVGIRPEDVAGFTAAQIAGALPGYFAARLLLLRLTRLLRVLISTSRAMRFAEPRTRCSTGSCALVLPSQRQFRECQSRGGNLGDDADTTAAIAGQIAGACYGRHAMPSRWLEKLYMRERIEQWAEWFFQRPVGE